MLSAGLFRERLMQELTIDGVLWAITLIVQAALAYLMIRKREGRNYPILLTYLIFNLIEDPLAWVLHNGPSGTYLKAYFAFTVLDYLLQFLLIVEIGQNVFRRSKESIPFRLWPVIIVAVLVCAIIAAVFAPQMQPGGPGQDHLTHVMLRVTLGLAILKLLLFAAMAGFAQFLGIGWKNRVLQLATGLAFYGAVSLLTQLSSSHLSTVNQASYASHLIALAQIQSGGYIGAITFWIWAFSRNEAPRKDFTPQMQEVLVTIAESAKRTRLAVTRSTDRR
jgi:hypothetical protein